MAMLHLVTLLVLQSGFGFDQQMQTTMIQVAADGASKRVVKDPIPATESLVEAAAHTSSNQMRSKLISQQDEEHARAREEWGGGGAGFNAGAAYAASQSSGGTGNTGGGGTGNSGGGTGGRPSYYPKGNRRRRSGRPLSCHQHVQVSGGGGLDTTNGNCCFSSWKAKVKRKSAKGGGLNPNNIPKSEKGDKNKLSMERNFDEIDGIDEIDGVEKGPRRWLDEKGPYDYKRASRLCFRVQGGCKSAMEIVEDGQEVSADPENCGMLKRKSYKEVDIVPVEEGDCRGPVWACTVADVKKKLCEGFSGKCEWCKKSRQGLWHKDTPEKKAKWKSAWANKTISEDAYFERHCKMCTFHAHKCKSDNQSESK